MNIRSAYDTQKMVEKGQKVPQLRDEIGILMDKKAHITLLLLPVMGIFIFTVLPGGRIECAVKKYGRN